MPAFLELGGQIISAIGEGLWAAIEPFSGQIGNWFSQTIQKVVSWGSDMISKCHQADSGLFNAIVNKVREIPCQMWGRQKYCFGNLEWYFKLNWVDNK